MRVIAGQYRSRRLMAPPGTDTRPTSDRLRETLFNVLSAGIPESVWFDLFAGSGAVGIEALSRGARMVYFVESAARAAQTIRANLRSLSITEGFEVQDREAVQALRALDAAAVVCDFCFIDPPYAEEAAYEQSLGFLSQSRLLTQKSIVIAEHDKHSDLAERYGALQRFRRLQQGDAVLSFYRLG
ncbi:MAG: 16S rRNA (guanine(966)-N(2))-methyltransferase RsmD [Acidobacteria bacterium]|nr:MAG: 16S rRNA (guanine(966)-N(2))-methyltransferase RsmD [Acidobacteriota bacterium]